MRTKEEFDNNFPVQVELTVQWGDMDAFGHVNNTMYFRYFETARLAYFQKLGLLDEMKKIKIGPILAATDCQFKRALVYPDQIIAGASITEKHSHGFMMAYGIYSQNQATITSLGTGRIVMIDYSNGAKVKPTAQQLKQIAQIQKGQCV